MGISGISDYSSLFANYKVPEIPSVNLEKIKSAETLQPKQPELQPQKTPDIDLSIEEKSKEQKPAIDVKEISLTFNAGEDYGYIGRDSNIENLDMQKAISDMKKDQVLQEYQYFVGKTENLFENHSGEDGLVFLKF